MIDVNLRGVLYGIAAALPVFARQGSGHVINVVSTAGLKIVPTMGVYAATKNAVRTVTEALRQEAGPNLRVTEVSPGMIATDFASSMTDERVKAAIAERLKGIAIPRTHRARHPVCAGAAARVDVGSIVIRPTRRTRAGFGSSWRGQAAAPVRSRFCRRAECCRADLFAAPQKPLASQRNSTK